MCEWCKENEGEPYGCQNCGRMICWDYSIGSFDDVIAHPYVTSSGDVYCYRCGIVMEEAEERMLEEEACFFPPDPYDDF